MLPKNEPGSVKLQREPPEGVLVLYVYSDTNIEYTNNLKYFLARGVQANDGVDYIIVVNSAHFSVRFHQMSSLCKKNFSFLN